jgi:hypothetical protein
VNLSSSADIVNAVIALPRKVADEVKRELGESMGDVLVNEMGPLIRARHALLPLAQAWVEATPTDKRKSLEIPAPLLASGQQLEARLGEDLEKRLGPLIIEANECDREKSRERLFFYTGAFAFVLLTVFGVEARPEVTPAYLFPGTIIGSVGMEFATVNGALQTQFPACWRAR